MKISAAMISWNEAKTIDLALKSIAGFVDEVIIADTGSFDGTQKIAQEIMDSLDLSGQIKQVRATKLSDGRLESYLLCDGDFILVQDSNVVLTESLKRAMMQHIEKNPNSIGAIKSLNLMGDYEHYFKRVEFMVHHKVFVRKESVKWELKDGRPDDLTSAFIGDVVNLTNWAVNLSRVRPAWRYWLRGEPFDPNYYSGMAGMGHTSPANLQYHWQNQDKYYSILEFVEELWGYTLEDVKKMAPEWFLRHLRNEAYKLPHSYREGLPEVIKEELKNPRYKLIYDKGIICGREPEL